MAISSLRARWITEPPTTACTVQRMPCWQSVAIVAARLNVYCHTGLRATGVRIITERDFARSMRMRVVSAGSPAAMAGSVMAGVRRETIEAGEEADGAEAGRIGLRGAEVAREIRPHIAPRAGEVHRHFQLAGDRRRCRRAVATTDEPV